MKIAIPTHEQHVDDHFGHCKVFTVFEVEENKITNRSEVPSTQGCGCKSNIIEVLKEQGVDVFLAGNIGQGAFNKIAQAGIQVLRGCSGPVNEVVEAYLAGDIQDNLKLCVGGTDDHDCSH